jgi:hypothetical protein
MEAGILLANDCTLKRYHSGLEVRIFIGNWPKDKAYSPPERPKLEINS